jgi:N-acetylglucosaminyl-diphospho-decaprenol L-rhamnosyltransferase
MTFNQSAVIQIIVVTYNSKSELDECLTSICNSELAGICSVTVFDNASLSPPELPSKIKEIPVDVVANQSNLGFGRGNNAAMLRSQSEFVLLLNPDAFVAPKAIQNALNLLVSDEDIGAVGASLFDTNGERQPSARYAFTPWSIFLLKSGLQKKWNPNVLGDHDWNRKAEIECDWVPGCFILMRRSLITKIGLFDPRFFLYFEEVDLCKRIRGAGKKIVCSPHVVVHHIGGVSAGTVAELTPQGKQISPLQQESEILFTRKHFGLLGLVGHLFLSWLLTAALVLKSKVFRRKSVNGSAHASETYNLTRLFFSTRFGTKPIH